MSGPILGNLRGLFPGLRHVLTSMWRRASDACAIPLSDAREEQIERRYQLVTTAS